MATKLKRNEFMQRISERSEQAAERFMRKLIDGFSRHNVPLYKPELQGAWDLIKAAYLLYDHAWNCHNHDIRDWQWPIDELNEGGKFDGPQPWSVLLNRAVTQLKTYKSHQ